MRYWKYLPLIALIFTSVLSAQEYGYIKITCDRDSIPIFLDGGELGVSPIPDSIKVPIGAHTVSLFPVETLEEAKEKVKTAKIKEVLLELFGAFTGLQRIDEEKKLKAIEEGSKRVFIRANRTTEVNLNYERVKLIMDSGDYKIVLFWKPYDDVFERLLNWLREDGFTINTSDKERGYIGTNYKTTGERTRTKRELKLSTEMGITRVMLNFPMEEWDGERWATKILSADIEAFIYRAIGMTLPAAFYLKGDLGLKLSEGKIIESLDEDGPAYSVGLKEGDELVKINGFKVKDILPEGMVQLLFGIPGEKVTITVERKGELMTVTPTFRPLKKDWYK